jgi:hypothetical protein
MVGTVKDERVKRGRRRVILFTVGVSAQRVYLDIRAPDGMQMCLSPQEICPVPASTYGRGDSTGRHTRSDAYVFSGRGLNQPRVPPTVVCGGTTPWREWNGRITMPSSLGCWCPNGGERRESTNGD